MQHALLTNIVYNHSLSREALIILATLSRSERRHPHTMLVQSNEIRRLVVQQDTETI